MRDLRSRRRGIAMVLAILVLAILVVVVLQLVFTTRVEEALARNARDEGEAEKAEDAAVALARVLLASKEGAEDEPDTPASSWAAVRQNIELGNAQVDVEIVDEARKLNIRLLTSKSERVRQWAEEALKRLVEAARTREEEGTDEADPERLVERIVEWARKGETGSKTRPGGGRGGEEGAELRLVTIAELLFLEDFDRFLVFGKRGTAAEAEEREEEEEQDDLGEPEEEEELENLPLAEVLTVWGDGRVNINTACAEVLMALHPGITEEVAKNIIAYREREPGAAEEGEEGAPPPPAPPPAADPGTVAQQQEDPTSEMWFQTVAELRTVEGLVQQEKQIDVLRDLLAVAGKTPRTGKNQKEDYRDAPLCVRSRFFKAHVTVRCRKALRRVTVILYRTETGAVQVLRKGEGVQ